MRLLLTGVVAAALLASAAAAGTRRAADDPYVQLCGPSSCAQTTDPAGVAQFTDFVGTIDSPGQIPGFPTAVGPYYRVKGSGLKLPAVYAPNTRQIGIIFKPGGNAYWTSLGPHTTSALGKIAKGLKPFPAPLPASIRVDNKAVKIRPIYRHLFDNFPQVYGLKASTKPWIGIQVKWHAGSAWPQMGFTLRRGTRVMLRPDYAVTVSKGLAARITADAPKKKH